MSKEHFGKSQIPLSPAVRAGDLVYVSGQVPTDRSGAVVPGGVEEQTRQVMENIKAALALAGCEMSDVVKCLVILTDASEFGAFNKVYASYFPKDPPARTTLKAGLMMDIKVEIEAIAYRPV